MRASTYGCLRHDSVEKTILLYSQNGRDGVPNGSESPSQPRGRSKPAVLKRAGSDPAAEAHSRTVSYNRSAEPEEKSAGWRSARKERKEASRRSGRCDRQVLLLAKSSNRGLADLVVYIVVVVGVFYLLMVRPRRRRRRAQQDLLFAIEKGDEVVTVDGMVGTVRQIPDRFVVVEVADHTQVRLLRSAVSQVLRDGGGTPARR